MVIGFSVVGAPPPQAAIAKADNPAKTRRICRTAGVIAIPFRLVIVDASLLAHAINSSIGEYALHAVGAVCLERANHRGDLIPVEYVFRFPEAYGIEYFSDLALCKCVLHSQD